MLAEGWTAGQLLGRVEPPLGRQVSAAEYVDDWTWQALCLMELASQGPAE